MCLIVFADLMFHAIIYCTFQDHFSFFFLEIYFYIVNGLFILIQQCTKDTPTCPFSAASPSRENVPRQHCHIHSNSQLLNNKVKLFTWFLQLSSFLSFSFYTRKLQVLVPAHACLTKFWSLSLIQKTLQQYKITTKKLYRD